MEISVHLVHLPYKGTLPEHFQKHFGDNANCHNVRPKQIFNVSIESVIII